MRPLEGTNATLLSSFHWSVPSSPFAAPSPTTEYLSLYLGFLAAIGAPLSLLRSLMWLPHPQNQQPHASLSVTALCLPQELALSSPTPQVLSQWLPYRLPFAPGMFLHLLQQCETTCSQAAVTLGSQKSRAAGLGT